MKCPHCLIAFYEVIVEGRLTDGAGSWSKDRDGFWDVWHTRCPSCGHATIWLRVISPTDFKTVLKEFQVWPKGSARAPVPAEVLEEFAADYREACLVLSDSAKASAALSRRCLQRLLREHVKVKPGTLGTEIDQVLAAKTLPSDLAGDVDAIRNVGNFAAHPLKDTNTGEIIEVEPGEAEWLLDVLEGLFDFYFVRPAERAAKRGALNQKLKGAGKPPMK